MATAHPFIAILKCTAQQITQTLAQALSGANKNQSSKRNEKGQMRTSPYCCREAPLSLLRHPQFQ